MRISSLLTALLICLSVGLLARAEDGKKAEKPGVSDKQLLQGNWKIVKVIKNGEPEDIKDGPAYMKFADDKVTHSKGDAKNEGTFALDESKSPRRITLTGTSGEKAGSVFEAIYDLAGDTLKIAYGTGDNIKTPPKDFAGGEGSGMMVLEREKK